MTNQGTIVGLTFDGVNLAVGGVVTNSGSAADIIGASSGVASYDAHTTVTNQGRITGDVRRWRAAPRRWHRGEQRRRCRHRRCRLGRVCAKWRGHGDQPGQHHRHRRRRRLSRRRRRSVEFGHLRADHWWTEAVSMPAAPRPRSPTRAASSAPPAYGVFLEAGGSVTNSGTARAHRRHPVWHRRQPGRRHHRQPGQHFRQLTVPSTSAPAATVSEYRHGGAASPAGDGAFTPTAA